MSEIHVSCKDQVLKLTKVPIIASGGVNETKVVFTFCEKWDGFVKTAIFYVDADTPYYAILDENDTCILPWEVCAENGSFYMTVFGNKDDIRRTSSVVKYKVSKGVVVGETYPSDPTPEVYEQILAKMEEVSSDKVSFLVEQTLTEDQKAQARNNIGAPRQLEVDWLNSKVNPDGSFVLADFKTGENHNLYANNGKLEMGGEIFLTKEDEQRILEDANAGKVLYTEQELTEDQKAQARANIGAPSQAEADFFHSRLKDGMVALTDTKTGDNHTLSFHNGKLEMDGATFLTDEDEHRIAEGAKAGAVLYTQQYLTEEQQTQARGNIGAASKNEIVKTAVLYESQNLTPEQETTARLNINAADLDDLQDLVNRFDEAEKRIPTAKTYELIATTTVEEDDPKDSVTFNIDSNGNPFELTDFIIKATAAFVDGNKSTLYMNVNKELIINNGAIGSIGTAPRTFQIFFRSENDGYKRIEFTNSMINEVHYNPQRIIADSRLVPPMAGLNIDPITEIKLYTLLPSDGAKEWVVGSTFELWGVRK